MALIPPLLRTRRFLPLLGALILGALNDNLFKNAMVISLVMQGPQAGAGLAAAAGGVFIAPYILFSAAAGHLADGMDKGRLIRLAKLAEVVLMVAAAGALVSGQVWALMLVLAGLGAQATLFGPVKYGILPQLLTPGELLAGNALMEAGTFGAILAGTILGGALVGLAHGPAVVGVAGMLGAVLGAAAAWFVPAAPAAGPSRAGWNLVGETWRLLQAARANARIWRAVLGLSWFWALGATYLAVFPVLARDVFHADNAVVTLLLAGFVLGIGSGSLLGSRMLHGEVSLRFVRRAGLVLSACTLGFAVLCAGPWAAAWRDVGAMLLSLPGAGAWIGLVGAAAAGGVFSLPLYTTLQQAAAENQRAQMVAANNVMNAVFMVVGAGVIAGLAALGWGPSAMLGLVAALNLAVAWWIAA